MARAEKAWSVALIVVIGIMITVALFLLISSNEAVLVMGLMMFTAPFVPIFLKLLGGLAASVLK